jgi:hypothetical protein
MIFLLIDSKNYKICTYPDFAVLYGMYDKKTKFRVGK